MANVRIIYGSETGNTESIAEEIARILKEKGHTVLCQGAADADTSNIAEGYDMVLLGTSVWGTDSIDLQSDFESFASDFGALGLEGVKCAAFASGDTSFEYYCGGVDWIEEHLQEVNAKIVNEGLRIEGDASGSKDEIAEWAEKIAQSL